MSSRLESASLRSESGSRTQSYQSKEKAKVYEGLHIPKPKRQKQKDKFDLANHEVKDQKKNKKNVQGTGQRALRGLKRLAEKSLKADEKKKGGDKREIELICDILEYYFGQYQLGEEVSQEFCNDKKTCFKWQVEEIAKQTSDTNLGDFIIKLPNPDNLSDEYKDLFPQHKENDTSQELNLPEAMSYFSDFFELENINKAEVEREQIAYVVAYYLLDCSTIESHPDLDSFQEKFQLLKKILGMKLTDYNHFKETKQFADKEILISQYSQERYDKLFSKKKKGQKSILGSVNADQNQIKFKKLMEEIRRNMEKQLLGVKVLQNLYSPEDINYILSKTKSIADIFRVFPKFFAKILGQATEEENMKDLKRNLYKGQYLKKTISGENVMWVNTKSRPHDIYTLLRNCLVYKLVKKHKFYVRTFLSKDENYILLVIKTSESNLESYAESNKMNMEIDLGASDLFSFEPVDHYLRPMRLSSYITDQEFINNYSLKGGVKSKTKQEKQEEQSKSIESEAVNIFKKAEVMNEDELRATIIEDQNEVNLLHNWVRKKLNIEYLNQKPLVNSFNTEKLSRESWETYYVYNKLIASYIKKVQILFNVHKDAKEYRRELLNNIGMIFRLMFVKALYICNDTFYNHRDTKSFMPRIIQNIYTTETKLKNIWTYLGVENPTGFWPYLRTKKTERIWRKFQINELKDRSKFFPSERIVITNVILTKCFNIGKCLERMHVKDFFPLHDPFILKNIAITPYLQTVKKLGKTRASMEKGPNYLDPSIINNLYSLYECQLTKSDFTKMSIENKLQFKLSEFKTFSTESVRYYCGEKIAFYFEFMRFLAVKAFPFILIALILQILLWVQNSNIQANGTSSLTDFNNALIFIFTFLNVFWTTNLVETWKAEEKKLAQKFGVSNLKEQQQKRVKFEGSFKRDFETDDLNYEYVPKWKTILKVIFTIVLNLAFVFLVGVTILFLFILKSIFFQLGYAQTVVNTLPSVIIAIAVQIFNFLYTKLIRMITIFENHKTISEYESSLISKTSLITFLITFYSIFIFAFFSSYLSSSFVCQLRLTSNDQVIQNCAYFVSAQLFSFVMVDFAMIVVGALTPLLVFKLKEYFASRQPPAQTKFAFNFFESIDEFYQEQDRMQTFMFNDEIDATWTGFMKIVNVFSALALFGPALPFTYVMMFFAGIIRLHASKYEVIFLKKRPLPIKARSINSWLTIIEAISFVSIVTNIAYMIYTRSVFTKDQSKIFFFLIIMFFLFKFYLLSQYKNQEDEMMKRNQIKATDLLIGRKKDKNPNVPQMVNTDIENVYYDEKELERRFEKIRPANVKPKN